MPTTAGFEDATPAAAVEELMESEGARIYALGLRLCRDRTAAEDLAQETFLQAFRKWDQFEGRSEPSTSLYTIAGRICQRWGRRRSGEPRQMESLSELLPSGESAVAALPAGEQNALDKQLESKQEALDRGVDFPVAPAELCSRCRSLIATLDLTYDACRYLGDIELPAELRQSILDQTRT